MKHTQRPIGKNDSECDDERGDGTMKHLSILLAGTVICAIGFAAIVGWVALWIWITGNEAGGVAVALGGPTFLVLAYAVGESWYGEMR